MGAERPVLLDLTSLTTDIDGHFLGGDGLSRVRETLADGGLPELDPAQGVALRVGAPVAWPGKVICIGLDYRDHAEETGAAIPQRPVVFMKDLGTVVGPNAVSRAMRSATTSPSGSSSWSSPASGTSGSPARPSTRSVRGWSPPTRSATRRTCACAWPSTVCDSSTGTPRT